MRTGPKAREEFDRVEVRLSSFLKDVKVEPKLEPISLQIAAKQEWVVEQLRILKEQETAEERKQAAQEHDRLEHGRFQRFLELRQEAQLFAAVPGDQLSPDRLKKLRSAAHEALAMYAKDPGALDDVWTLADSLPTVLSKAEKTRLRDGCYDLLLILTQEADPAQGLRILDRAVQLQPELTAAYHLRRADCLGPLGRHPGPRPAKLERPSNPSRRPLSTTCSTVASSPFTADSLMRSVPSIWLCNATPIKPRRICCWPSATSARAPGC